jgi:hypothetical protein
MTRAGRAVRIQFVLIATVIYHAMALHLPSWALKAINKICRNYLWRGRKEALGGHCLIAWPKVARPKELGGLGIPDIKNLNRALRLRWLWLRKTELSKPWVSLPFQANADLEAFFSMAVVTEIGDGTNTLFWQDRWLFGKSVGDLAPTLSTLIPTRIANKRFVAEALNNWRWVSDMHGTVTVQVVLGSAYGNLGHQTNAVSSCGWSLTIAAGQLIGWRVATSHTRIDALCVIKRRKPSTTYLSPASFLTNSGVFYCSELALQGCLLNPLKHPLTNGGEG